MQSRYYYGMRLRGFGPMCQPMGGLRGRLDDPNGEYYDVLAYDRQLTPTECKEYELDFITRTRVADGEENR